MKFNNYDEETTQEYKKRILDNALSNLRTSDKNGRDVKQEVSRLLLNDSIKGRPQPASKGKINPTRVRCNRQERFTTYPKKLKTDKKKFFYLRDLFVEKSIGADIFTDLASMLDKIKPGKIDRIIKAQGQSIVGSNIMEVKK